MKIHILDTGKLKLDGGAMFGVVPKVLWNKIYPADENNQVKLVMRCLLIETGDKKIIIDTGVGSKMDEKKSQIYFLEDILPLDELVASKGINPEEITDVILTHLHFDHCGGSVKYNSKGEAVPVFPNANYIVSTTQWEAAVNPNKRERASYFPENFIPLQEHNLLQLIDSNYRLTEDIELRLFNGHTNGQIVPFIKYNDNILVFIGDIIPSVANIPLSWITAYDMQPLVALEEKEEFLNEAEKNNYILVMEHDIYNECCTVRKTEKGVRVHEIFRFEDIEQK